MEIQGEKTILVENKEYFFVDQFARLTQRTPSTIRMLITNGNRVRKLKSLKFGHKPLVLASELFEFPFITKGHPSYTMGDFVERFYIEKGELLKAEEAIPRCQAQ